MGQWHAGVGSDGMVAAKIHHQEHGRFRRRTCNEGALVGQHQHQVDARPVTRPGLDREQLESRVAVQKIRVGADHLRLEEHRGRRN